MPNWCSNDVTVLGASDRLEEFRLFLTRAKLNTPEAREEATDVSDKFNLFNNLVPMPEQLKDVTVSVSDPKEFANAIQGNQEAVYSDWYTWSIAHWGTKWDVSPRFCELIDNALELSYDTAWSPAIHVWETVSKEFPTLLIKIRYIEEGMSFIGETWLEGGDTIKDICLDITPEMYVAAGATLGDDGKIDWDNDQDYDLYQLFDGEGLKTWDKEGAAL